MSKVKLPPIEEVDDSVSVTKETITFNRCNHKLYLVSPTEARCKNCGAGWTGPRIAELVKISNS